LRWEQWINDLILQKEIGVNNNNNGEMKKNFLDIAEEFSNPQTARYTVLLVPYDGTSTWQKGADKGPEALISASCFVELYEMETGQEAYKRGIYTKRNKFVFSSPEAMIREVQAEVGALFKQGTMPIIIGGEHSVSIGAVKALSQAFPNLSVLQLDAHTDLRADYQGSPYNHACTMARIKEFCPIVQVGIRAMDRAEVALTEPGSFFPAKDIHDNEIWMSKALEKLSADVYLTVDLDVFDPSLMPATGTPEPGGLSWYPVLKFLRQVIEQKNLVGFDVVELCPKDDPHPAFLAATLVYKLISYHTLKELKK
jgi:agmatinase